MSGSTTIPGLFPDAVTAADLFPFCGVTTKTAKLTHSTNQPFYAGGNIYATNGVIAARISHAGRLEFMRYDGSPVAKLNWWGSFPLPRPKPFPVTPPLFVGEGIEDEHSVQPHYLGKANFDLRQLNKIAGLPRPVVYEIVKTRGVHVLLFESGDLEGILMQCDPVE
jgi:hypothetical protein